jgi:hypothetical protein
MPEIDDLNRAPNSKGSASIKKQAPFSISLNAHVGLSFGQERLRGSNPKFYQAIATPIGLSFNVGLKKAGSLSILASAIDLGALTAYRFQDSTASVFPELRFENVLAPGGYLVYSLPKWPISIGFGGQLGPHLRSVTAANGLGLQNSGGWRWGAFVAVDIPLTHLYTSNKRLKKCPKP